MGSAVELHSARQAGRLVLVVAPSDKMRQNWVVRSYAHHVFDDVSQLEAWLKSRRAAATPLLPPPEALPPALAAGLDGYITFIYTADASASRQFYETGLNLRVRCEVGPVLFYALPGRGGGSLGVVPEGVSAAESPPCSARTARRDTVMLCLLTRDVFGAVAQCTARGGPRVRVEQPARENARFGIYNALLRDPDGYIVEVQRFLDDAEHARFT